MFAIFIPTYNEKDNLPIIVKEIDSVLKDNYRIIIVDDSSPDGTGEIADELSNKYPITVVHRSCRGRGSASIVGFQKALEQDVEFVIEMDADLSHDPKYLPEFLEKIKKCDLVVGSRYTEGGNEVDRDIIRVLLSRYSNNFVKLILGLPIHDCTSGYKCYRRKVLEQMDMDTIISTEYSIGIEMLYRAYNNNFTIEEIPILFRNRARGESKLSMKTTILYFYVVLLLKLKK